MQKSKNSETIRASRQTKTYTTNDVRHKGSPSYSTGKISESRFDNQQLISSGKPINIKIGEKTYQF